MELKKYKLGDVADIVNGATPSTHNSENYDGSIIWITPKDLSGQKQKIIRRGQRNISEIGFNNCSAQMIPPYNILMSSRAPIGLLAINENECCTNQGFKNLVLDKSICDTDYMYYYLQFHMKEIEALGSGTTFKEISKSALQGIEIRLPDLEKQRDIAKCLSDLDRKIELNKQINDNLEAMAKQLYDYWFVQFDFPNEEGKPYKSSGGAMVWNEKLKREIPEGWYAENICKIANILSGGTPSKAVDEYWNNGTIPFFGPTDCNGSVFQIKTADHITQKGLEHCASSLFEEGIVIITARGSIGKLVIVGTPMAMNQSCYALQSKEGEYEYLYFLTTQLIDCLKAKGSGSVFKSIIASDIEHSTLCVATENVVSDFCKKVKPLFEKLKTNTIEIAELTKQRDELLPLLMNGQAMVHSN
ncbi:restriction endonuclease subunit S [Leyella stercorea]|uniref:restriction endonuclease subunit S n=1 Tax=Leyella stercorea TaxID=363265 RepID=UPI003AF63DEA